MAWLLRPEIAISIRLALVAAILLAAVTGVALIVVGAPRFAPQSSPPVATPSSLPTAPSTSRQPGGETGPVPSASEIDLAAIGWYTIVPVGFGHTEPPDPDDPPHPEPYDLLTVGTLDGTVAAEVQLSSSLAMELAGVWANGPYRSLVLVGEDDGSETRLFTVSVIDAAQAPIFQTTDSIIVGAIHPVSGDVYFVPVDRNSRTDLGLWRVASDAARAELVDGPLIETPNDFASRWTMHWSVGGDSLVIGMCRVRACQTLVHDPSSGRTRRDEGGSEVIGVTDAGYVTSSDVVSLRSGERVALPRPISGQASIAGTPGAWYAVEEPAMSEPRAYALEAWRLTGGPVRTLVEAAPAEATQARLRLGPGAGAEIPPGWVLRWPDEGSRFPNVSVPPHVWYAGELVNVISGQRIPIPPTIWPDTPTGCDPIGPIALPSGAPPGDPVLTSGGHYLWASWGEGADLVVQSVGGWLHALPAGASGPLADEVIVRGLPGRVISMGGGIGWAIAWEEQGCRYEVQLAPGVTHDQAMAYAAAFEPSTD